MSTQAIRISEVYEAYTRLLNRDVSRVKELACFSCHIYFPKSSAKIVLRKRKCKILLCPKCEQNLVVSSPRRQPVTTKDLKFMSDVLQYAPRPHYRMSNGVFKRVARNPTQLRQMNNRLKRAFQEWRS